MRRLLCVLAISIAGLAGAGPAPAQQYPSHVVTNIVP
jgi:hypothetical protein